MTYMHWILLAVCVWLVAACVIVALWSVGKSAVKRRAARAQAEWLAQQEDQEMTDAEERRT